MAFCKDITHPTCFYTPIKMIFKMLKLQPQHIVSMYLELVVYVKSWRYPTRYLLVVFYFTSVLILVLLMLCQNCNFAFLAKQNTRLLTQPTQIANVAFQTQNCYFFCSFGLLNHDLQQTNVFFIFLLNNIFIVQETVC